MDIRELTTAQLTEELSKREGITKIIAQPHEDKEIKVNGPAIILINVD